MTPRDVLIDARKLIFQQQQLCFGLQVADLWAKHGFEHLFVNVTRHEFCDCLIVAGSFEEDGDQLHEAWVPIDIPADWSPPIRDALREEFISAATAAVAARRQVVS